MHPDLIKIGKIYYYYDKVSPYFYFVRILNKFNFVNIKNFINEDESICDLECEIIFTTSVQNLKKCICCSEYVEEINLDSLNELNNNFQFLFKEAYKQLIK